MVVNAEQKVETPFKWFIRSVFVLIAIIVYQLVYFLSDLLARLVTQQPKNESHADECEEPNSFKFTLILWAFLSLFALLYKGLVSLYTRLFKAFEKPPEQEPPAAGNGLLTTLAIYFGIRKYFMGENETLYQTTEAATTHAFVTTSIFTNTSRAADSTVNYFNYRERLSRDRVQAEERQLEDMIATAAARGIRIGPNE
ncbi:MAG: hypothetical protein ACHQJ6_00165 [Candidatus Berkiellales bacterium]